MTSPPRYDDTNLGDEELLLRRICDTPAWTKVDSDGEVRPSSAAFLDDYTNEVSVSVESQTTQERVMDGYPDMGLVSITAGVPRGAGFIVSPTPEVDDPAHRVICCPTEISKNSRKKTARVMAAQAEWRIKPLRYRNE